MDPITPNQAGSLLEVNGICVAYGTRSVLEDVSLRIRPGEVIGLIGESGTGKSLLASVVMGLLPRDAKVVAGSIRFQGEDLLKCHKSRWRAIRGSGMAMVFQDPATALHPLLPVGKQIREAVLAHSACTQSEAENRAKQLLEGVQFSEPATIYPAYPHQLSGGQRQRVLIALALSGQPSLLIADEPTSSLDTTTQSKVLSLLRETVSRLGLSVLFITHDPTLLRDFAARLIVLHQGKIVEDGPFATVCRNPDHPYTRLVVSSILPDPSGFATDDTRDKKDLPLLVARSVTKTYCVKSWFTRRTRRVDALVDVDLEIFPRKTLGIVGESGCGKSTLARCLAGLDRPDSGTIQLHGELEAAKRKVQLIQQDATSALNPCFSVEELVAEPLQIAKISGRALRARVREAMEDTGLPETLLHRRPRELSGGQRQRVAIARALCVEPRVLILDESLSGLDLPVQQELFALLSRLQESHSMAFVFISHDLRQVACCSHTVAVMDEGRIVECGTPDRIFNSPKEACTQRLIEALPRWDRPY